MLFLMTVIVEPVSSSTFNLNVTLFVFSHKFTFGVCLKCGVFLLLHIVPCLVGFGWPLILLLAFAFSSGVSQFSAYGAHVAWVLQFPCLWFILLQLKHFCSASATAWCPWVFWAASYCLTLATASFRVVGCLRSSARSSLFGHLVVISSSSSLSFEIVDAFASFVSLRNSDKNPEADWFVPGQRLVSLWSLTWIGCRLSK